MWPLASVPLVHSAVCRPLGTPGWATRGREPLPGHPAHPPFPRLPMSPLQISAVRTRLLVDSGLTWCEEGAWEEPAVGPSGPAVGVHRLRHGSCVLTPWVPDQVPRAPCGPQCCPSLRPPRVSLCSCVPWSPVTGLHGGVAWGPVGVTVRVGGHVHPVRCSHWRPQWQGQWPCAWVARVGRLCV